MRYVAKEWAKGKALQSCDILFLIDLSQYDAEIMLNSITDLLKWLEYEDLENLVNVIFGNNGNGTCFLLDEYHELHEEHNKFIVNIMEGNIIQESFCMLASRPDMNHFQKPARFEIIGYNVSHLLDHLEKLTENNTVLVSAIMRVWEKHKKYVHFTPQYGHDLKFVQTKE